MSVPQFRRFAVADDDVLFRSLLIDALCADYTRKIAYCTASGDDLLLRLASRAPKPDLILLDLYMPGISTIELISEIRNIHRSARLVVYNTHFQAHTRLQLQELRVDVYCEKDIPVLESITRRLFDDHQRLVIPEAYYQNWQNKLPATSGTPLPSFPPELSIQEIKVMSGLCLGHNTREIATSLHRSERTIENIINRLLKKFSLNRRIELIRVAFENGLCTLLCKYHNEGLCSVRNIFDR